MTLRMTLPTQVTVDSWLRHGLTNDDIAQICDMFCARYVWLSALSKGIDTSSSCLRASFGNSYDMLVSSKATATRKLQALVQTIRRQQSSSRISTRLYVPSQSFSSQTHHHPPLPLHVVSSMMMYNISSHITTMLSSPPTENIVDGLIDYSDCKWLPRCFVEKDVVVMTRAVTLETYQMSRPHYDVSTTPLCNSPILLIVNDSHQQMRYVLVEETIAVTIGVY
jgi:hypothetical protein